MSGRSVVPVLLAAVVATVLLPATLAAAASCESLAALALQDTTIVSATSVPAGPFTPPAFAVNAPAQFRPPNLPAFCRVVGRVTPAVKFEVWMPASGWNGKFEGVGGGGFAGVISYGAMVTALNRAYATASTDTGHDSAGGQWALGHPELITDYAYRAIHETTVKAKAIVEAFYGKGPQLSYFSGCSTGGRQGLLEAQRYPTDYNGIVAIAPVNFLTHLLAGELWIRHAALKDPASDIPSDKFTLINQAALAACDARDGVRDGVLEDPTRCDFDPKTLQCQGPDTERCLTASQVEAVKKIYAPSRNPRTRAEIFPGLAPGSELGWNALAGGPNPFPIPADFMKYFVFDDPNWDWRTFDFDKDVTTMDAKFASMMNATDPNLSAFKARGGKIILAHGWNDQLVPPLNTINYYKSVQKAMGGKVAAEFVRLFMAPGMLHCGGGPGPNTFDAVGALESWVERGKTPETITASHATGGAVDRTRPLCPYPQVAVYKGRGSIDDAANFVCR